MQTNTASGLHEPHAETVLSVLGRAPGQLHDSSEQRQQRVQDARRGKGGGRDK